MSKAKSIKAYPTELHDLVIRFTHGDSVVKINNRKRAILNNLRFDFYAFRKAIRQNGAQEMFLNLDAITARIEEEPDGSHTLIFALLDQHPMYSALREALNMSDAIAANSKAPMTQNERLDTAMKEVVHPYKSNQEELFKRLGYGSGATPASEASSPPESSPTPATADKKNEAK